jgi:acetyltransferase EpsM
MGREALAWSRDARPDHEVVAFFTADAAERPQGASLDLPLVTSVEELRELEVDGIVLGIGHNRLRRKVAEEVHAAGFALVTVVHPTAFLGPGVVLGEGCVIAPGCVVTRDVRLGRGVIVNYGASIGHDSDLADFVFLGPGAVLTGEVRLGSGALVGAGAVILPGRSVGGYATVGAGAVVTQDVSERSTVTGVPAGPHGRAGGQHDE